MKKLLILLILLLALPCYAGMLQAGKGGGSAGCVANSCSSATADNCGIALTLCEDWSATAGALNCSGTDGLRNCRNTWLISGSPTFTGTAIDGLTYSVELNANLERISKAITAADQYWIAFPFKTTANEATKQIMTLRDAGDATLCAIQIDGGPTNYQIKSAGGTARDLRAVATDTLIYFKMQAIKGTGADAVCNGWYSPTGKAGTWIAAGTQSTNGTWTNQIAAVKQTDALTDAGTLSYGAIKIATTDILDY